MRSIKTQDEVYTGVYIGVAELKTMEEPMKDFPEMVADEITAARSKFGPINGFHEGYAVLLEELDEFWDEVKRWPKRHCVEVMLKELVQIAAMAQRLAEDAGLVLPSEEPERDPDQAAYVDDWRYRDGVEPIPEGM
jgi:hypothetical protein